MLATVLAWASAILAAFIGYSSIFPSAQPCQHNIGCYLTPHSLNHTAEIKARIAAVLTLREPILHQHRSISANDSAFDQQVMTVAQSFQRYVQQLAAEQKVRVKDRQILVGISQAEKSYFACKQQIQQQFDGNQCHGTWNSYQNCFQEVKKARNQLSLLFENEQLLQQQIDQEMTQPQDKPEEKPQFLAELTYNQSIRENEASIRKIRESISSLELKQGKLRKQKDQAEDRVVSKERNYKQCWQNRRNYNQCEEIARQVKSISTGFLEQLKQQLEAKARLMREMMQMMVRMGKGENRKMPEHWNEMFQKHREQYKRMHNDYINNTLKEGKACGCTEQEEHYLQSEANKERKIIETNTAQIQKLTLQIEELRRKLALKEQERQKIISTYQQALKEYATSEPAIKETNLIRLKKRLETNRVSILNAKDQFNRINEQCNAIKQTLSGTIKDIDKVEDCLGKKDYLKQLRAETAKFLQPERSLTKLRATKKQLAKALASFNEL